jgi:parallel beta-helix repeat protein
MSHRGPTVITGPSCHDRVVQAHALKVSTEPIRAWGQGTPSPVCICPGSDDSDKVEVHGSWEFAAPVRSETQISDLGHASRSDVPYAGKKAESERLVNRLRVAVLGVVTLSRNIGRLFGGLRAKIAAVVSLVVVVGLITAIVVPGTGHIRQHFEEWRGTPSGPPTGTQLCNGGPDSSTLTGPSTAPKGAVTIPAGNDDPSYDQSYSLSPNTVYYFAPGLHTLGRSIYGHLTPRTGDTFIGAPGAIINGEGVNQYAFVGTATSVTIEYLTVENFTPGTDASAVNHDGASNWTIEYNTIEDNTGAGTGIGSNDVVTENCLTNNDQYGFNAYSSTGSLSNITLTNNEISNNDTNGSYDQSAYVVSYAVNNNVATIVTRGPMNFVAGHSINVGATSFAQTSSASSCSISWCANLSDTALDGLQTITNVISPTSFEFSVTTPNVGTTADPTGTVASSNILEGAAGGGKFWDASGGATVTGNWVHGNGYVGLWPDTDNAGFNFSGNYISNNWAEGIMYEASYNASITDNTFVDNTWGLGPSPAVSGFPASAIYLSEAGSDSRVGGPYGNAFAITGNVFTDNWGGVVIYENSNRACGISNDVYCTLVAPSTYTLSSCASGIPNGLTSNTPDYVDNCRWKAQNVSVTDNAFNFTPGNIGSDCTTGNTCGFNGLFSEFGTTPSTTHNGGWPSGASYPYRDYTVPNDISNHQNNKFYDNTYCASGGSWNFVGFAQGNSMTQSRWTSVEKNSAASKDSFGAQDAGSTFTSGGCPY